ncbi:MAG TPA: hypothetical protein VIJ57_08060 [Hanamia sp.]
MSLTFLLIVASCVNHEESGSKIKPAATVSSYRDGRHVARYRMDAKDQGVVLRYGSAPDSSDYLGARDVFVFEDKGTYYMHYDGAGLKGWLTCLATSTDLVNWIVKGPILDFGQPGSDDSRSASYGSVYYDGTKYHMFYVGTPNVTKAPDLIPAFPYLTRKAESYSPAGPWRKRYDIIPFSTKKGSFYSSAASPGNIIKNGNEYLMLFSAQSGMFSGKVTRTLSFARTKNLDSSWTIDNKPFLPIGEQIENSSVYYEPANKTWFVFTNHLGIKNDGSEYADGIWVYWTKDINHWNSEDKAVVLDSNNCKWSRPNLGLPSVIKVGKRLAIFYDGNTDRPVPEGSNGNMRRDIGLAWLELPLELPKGNEVKKVFKASVPIFIL